jgi:hypothetical protein
VSALDDYLAAVRRGAAQGLTQAAHRVAAVAVPMTPRETGDLRSAITNGVIPAHEVGGQLEAAIVVDGLPYAVRQHEDLTLNHDDGGPKFLERAVDETADEVGQIVTAAVRRATG